MGRSECRALIALVGFPLAAAAAAAACAGHQTVERVAAARPRFAAVNLALPTPTRTPSPPPFPCCSPVHALSLITTTPAEAGMA